MRCEKIEWITKQRPVFDKNIGTVAPINFLRLNVTDEYNYGMGHVDMADQLRNYYRCDHWLRNFKWWHAMFWWGIQVMMINSYLVYCRVCEDVSIKPMNHYQFQKECALAWIDPEGFGKVDGYKTPTDDEVSTISSVSSSKRRSRITDEALDPLKGSLRKRLNRNIGHWPSLLPRDKHRNSFACQLHKWASGKQKKSNIAFCAECNVALCLDCYESFHCVFNLLDEKECFRAKMDRETCQKEDETQQICNSGKKRIKM